MIFTFNLLYILLSFTNVHFDAYYGGLLIVFLLPMAGSLAFLIQFWIEDTDENRKKLVVGMLMAGLSVIAMNMWTICYILTLYDYNYVYLGSGVSREFH